MDIHNIDRAAAFTTKDGSEIRELLAHRNSCIRNQSLAEARLPAGRVVNFRVKFKLGRLISLRGGPGVVFLSSRGSPHTPASIVQSSFRPF